MSEYNPWGPNAASDRSLISRAMTVPRPRLLSGWGEMRSEGKAGTQDQIRLNSALTFGAGWGFGQVASLPCVSDLLSPPGHTLTSLCDSESLDYEELSRG